LNPNDFFTELKRRNFRVTGSYPIVSVLLFQVAEALPRAFAAGKIG
jgi:hypothetical protein